MVQYHALGLLYNIKKSDRLAVTKLVAKLTRSAPRSPFAVCMLVSDVMITSLVWFDDVIGMNDVTDVVMSLG